MTVTGSNADHRIPLRPRLAGAFAEALRKAVATGDAGGIATLAKSHGMSLEALRALVQDLREARGEAVVLAGAHLPGERARRGRAAQRRARRPGTTLRWNRRRRRCAATDVEEVVAAIRGGPDVVIFLGVNPVYDLPGRLRRLPGRSRPGRGPRSHRGRDARRGRTSRLPSAHNLESWNDASPMPGVTSLCQPMIAPLFDGRQEAESLLAWTKALAPDASALGRTAGLPRLPPPAMAGRASAATSVLAWEDALRRGFVGTPSASFPSLHEGRGGAPRHGRARGGSRDVRSGGAAPPRAGRRPLRRQRLAAGAARPGQQARLGQRGLRSRPATAAEPRRAGGRLARRSAAATNALRAARR